MFLIVRNLGARECVGRPQLHDQEHQAPIAPVATHLVILGFIMDSSSVESTGVPSHFHNPALRPDAVVLGLDMTPQGSLRKIGIELDLAKKPVLRNWFTMAAAAKELEPFLLGIEVTHFRRGAETTAVDLTGPPDVLRNFFSRFLSDEDRHVYNLSYGE